MKKLGYILATLVLLLAGGVVPKLSADEPPLVQRQLSGGLNDGQAQIVASHGSNFASTDDVLGQNGRYKALFYFDGDTNKQVTTPNEVSYYNTDLDGNYLAYSTTRNACVGNTCAAWPSSVNLYNTQNGQNTLLTPDSSVYRLGVTVSGNKVAWLQSPDSNISHNYYDVYLYDISSGVTTRVSTTGAPDVLSGHPRISGDHLYWITGYRSPSTAQFVNAELNDYNIAAGTTNSMSISPQAAVGRDSLTGDNGNIAWSDNTNLYMYDGSAVSTIYTGNSITETLLRGNVLVWLAVENDSYVYKIYTRSDGVTQTLTQDHGIFAITTDGRRVGYVQQPANSNAGLAILDTATSLTKYVDFGLGGIVNSQMDGNQAPLSVGENFIAWSGYHNNPGHGSQYSRLNVAEPQYTPGTPTNVHGLASAESQRAMLSWNAVPRTGSYNIYRDGSLITNVTTLSYTDENTGSGSPAYTVSALNYYGNEGAQSAAASILIDNDGPILGDIEWTNNPRSQSQTSTFTVNASDSPAGIASGEYYIADSNGNMGNPIPLTWNGTQFSATIPNTVQPGVYDVNVRAQDTIGNWSDFTNDFLVIYDGGGYRVSGGRATVPALADGDVLPGLTKPNQKNKVKFGVLVKYNNHNQITANSHFTMSYDTGKNCAVPSQAQNCHSTVLNSTSIDWLSSTGNGNSSDILQGTGTLIVDGTQTQVLFRVQAYDGSLWGGTDQVQVMVYAAGSNPATATPLYSVHLKDITKGDIKITPQTPPIVS